MLYICGLENYKNYYTSMNAKCKKTYVSPVILRQTSLAPRMELLAGSVVEDMKISTTGQEIENLNFDTSFDHNWN